MKKIIALSLAIIILTGCTTVKSPDELLGAHEPSPSSVVDPVIEQPFSIKSVQYTTSEDTITEIKILSKKKDIYLSGDAVVLDDMSEFVFKLFEQKIVLPMTQTEDTEVKLATVSSNISTETSSQESSSTPSIRDVLVPNSESSSSSGEVIPMPGEDAEPNKVAETDIDLDLTAIQDELSKAAEATLRMEKVTAGMSVELIRTDVAVGYQFEGSFSETAVSGFVMSKHMGDGTVLTMLAVIPRDNVGKYGIEISTCMKDSAKSAVRKASEEPGTVIPEVENKVTGKYFTHKLGSTGYELMITTDTAPEKTKNGYIYHFSDGRYVEVSSFGLGYYDKKIVEYNLVQRTILKTMLTAPDAKDVVVAKSTYPWLALKGELSEATFSCGYTLESKKSQHIVSLLMDGSNVYAINVGGFVSLSEKFFKEQVVLVKTTEKDLNEDYFTAQSPWNMVAESETVPVVISGKFISAMVSPSSEYITENFGTNVKLYGNLLQKTLYSLNQYKTVYLPLSSTMVCDKGSTDLVKSEKTPSTETATTRDKVIVEYGIFKTEASVTEEITKTSIYGFDSAVDKVMSTTLALVDDNRYTYEDKTEFCNQSSWMGTYAYKASDPADGVRYTQYVDAYIQRMETDVYFYAIVTSSDKANSSVRATYRNAFERTVKVD